MIKLISTHTGIVAVKPSRRAAFVASVAIVFIALLPALAAPHVLAAPAKPQCAITRPYDNATVSGKLRVTGNANMAADPIIKVQLRIDGGSLLIANGTDSWFFDMDTTMLSNGPHSIDAKSFDGTQYSDPAGVTFIVQNSPPEPPDGDGRSYYIIAGVVIIVVAVAVAAWRMMAGRKPQ